MKVTKFLLMLLTLVLVCTVGPVAYASANAKQCGKAPEGSTYVEHHVTPADRDGVSSIVGRYRAKGYNVPDWQSVATTNDLAAPYTIYAGETILCIPVQSAAPVQAIWPAEHTVTKGQMLSRIAQLYWIADWHEMAKQNNLKNPDQIFPKQMLVLPEPTYIAREHTGKMETNIVAQEIAPVKMSVKHSTRPAIPDRKAGTIAKEFLTITSNQVLLALVAMLLGGLLYLLDERASCRRELLRLRTGSENKDEISPHEEDPWDTQAITILEDGSPLEPVKEMDIDSEVANIQTIIHKRDNSPRVFRPRRRSS